MISENPELIQPENWAQPTRPTFTTPVFLLHDGGGTTFAYHFLESLGRYVYGIANPYFRTGQAFEGGIPEMGRLYASWIRATVAGTAFPCKRRNHDGSVSVLLGGWSLGGLLSLEVARELAEDRLVRVAGILMIDSVYPGRSARPTLRTIPLEAAAAAVQAVQTAQISSPAAEIGTDTVTDTVTVTDTDPSTAGMTKNQILSQRCMAEARRMVRDWPIPEWSGKLSGRRPRAILLRAKDYIPMGGSNGGGRRGVAGLDLSREDRMLGWGEYDDDLFDDVVDVEGHHFDLFAMERLEGITAAIRRGLDRLDQYSQVVVLQDGPWG